MRWDVRSNQNITFCLTSKTLRRQHTTNKQNTSVFNINKLWGKPVILLDIELYYIGN